MGLEHTTPTSRVIAESGRHPCKIRALDDMKFKLFNDFMINTIKCMTHEIYIISVLLSAISLASTIEAST